MAIYHASTKPIARSAGRSAVAAAAYRAGVELVDARTGLVHDYARKGGVLHTEILTPDGDGAERNALWDAAESAEKRKDARTAREWIVALPEELDVHQQRALVREFSQVLVDRYGVAVDLVIHAPDRKGDNRNFHAHILTTTRQVGRGLDGGLVFGAKSQIELGDKDRKKMGLTGKGADEVKAIRELWERTANGALERAGVDARIDARSFKDRGVDREPTKHLGPVATDMERQGKASDRGDINQEIMISNIQRARLSAEIVGLQAERERRIRREQARQAFAASHREIRPDVGLTAPVLAVAVEAWARQDRVDIQVRWNERLAKNDEKKEAARVERERALDVETAAEQRNGFRAADAETGNTARPAWAVYRERVLTEAYGEKVGRELGRWVKVEVDRGNRSLHIHNKGMDLTDYGDRLVAGMGGNDKEIAAMLKIAQAKGWKALTLTGSADFQLRAGAAALDAGFTLTDADLATRITAQRAAEVEARLVRDLEAAPVLAEWIRAHPKLAQAQRRAGGHLPFACPEGLDHADLQRSEVWAAADAWSVGRYGEGAEVEALKKDPDPLKAQAVGAGREAAFNAWARDGLTLRVGVDAPAGIGAIWHEASNTPTRADVERHAGVLMNRRKRAGVDHAVTVTFGMDVTGTERVLVLEHLLRQSVPLDGAALAKAGDGPELERARERLKTHEADGQQQVWYTQKLEQDRLARQWEEAAKTRADLVKKLDALAAHLERHGSEDAERCFQEAGFVKDEKGFYAYPDPDLPGVQKAWDALKAAQRREFEADVQKRADRVGYRAESGQWRQEQRAADPEHQRLVQEIKDDPSLKEMANAAYKQGIDRAQQERLAQLEQDRKALRNAAYKLGRRAEKAGSNAVKQAEMQREFGELVQRGVDLGVDEKALSQSLQRGRVAYREEQQEHRYSSPGGGMRR